MGEKSEQFLGFKSCLRRGMLLNAEVKKKMKSYGV